MQPGIGGFSSLLKVTMHQVFFISEGREFHSRGPATETILSPYRLRDGGVYKSLFVVEHNTLVAVYSSRSVM